MSIIPNESMVNPTRFIDLSTEIRLMIYEYLFLQPGGELLGLSREPRHDYNKGPPSTWVADSRQQGLVYDSESERAVPTNASFLCTCRLINREATPVFYGTNKIILYAEDNNDIFYWLLDIGEPNRCSIRHLEISWAYGVEIQSGRGNIYGIIETIAEMENSGGEEIQRHRDQLIRVVQHLEKKTVRLIIRTLHLLASNQGLDSLTVYLPGVDGANIWNLPNDNLYFAEEVFSNSTTHVHACIPEALRKIVGVNALTIGYTKDIELAEEIAKDAGARELTIRVYQDGNTLGLRKEERRKWESEGWRLEGAIAHKTLLENYSVERKKLRHSESRSDGGRLTSSMLVNQT
ncbi:hypothetical protein LPUS_04228 [Lasallia pustulata]|uniref:Uncharacterized protein n=1 Tax=Lasallia pustulata TaxID=136370 RepID=A0A1W5CWP1_9LECA|nr:hypothetical protein LPUS_04228 [Lasallia pustulata]